MKLRILSVLLACLLVFGLVPGAMATEPAETTEVTKPVRGEFECGDELTWTYEDGVLTITGQGEMDDYEEDAPWAKYKDEMEAVILEGVTYIGARAFKDYDELESVDFGDKLYEIGEEAFWSCSSLTEIRLPASFKVFGPSSFSGCKNLTEIHSEGKFPSFRQNCFWDTYATIYFPAARPWSVDLIQQLEEAFHGRIEFLASDGSDPYVPTEATEPATEVPTEAPTEMPTETTVSETEATVAVTEPPVETTEQVTEAPTQAPTEATQPETEEPEGDSPMKLIAIGFGAALGLGLIAGIALMLRQLKRKGKYSN